MTTAHWIVRNLLAGPFFALGVASVRVGLVIEYVGYLVVDLVWGVK